MSKVKKKKNAEGEEVSPSCVPGGRYMTGFSALPQPLLFA